MSHWHSIKICRHKQILVQIEQKNDILHKEPNAILHESPPQLADNLSERSIFLAELVEKKEANLSPCTHLSFQSFGSSIKSAKQTAMLSHLISRFIFGWAPVPVWGVRTISPPISLLGFDPRTVQSVASRHTDYDIPAHNV
jgi:hypothetical protein